MKPLLATALAFAMLLFPLGSGVLPAAEDTGPKAYEAAEALQNAGKYAEAEKAAQALVAARTKALGAKDEETLRARMLLASILHDDDKDAEAERLLRKLQPTMSKVFGKEAPPTLALQLELIQTVAGQGRVLNLQEKSAEAEQEYREVLPLCERVHGPENVKTLRACHGLAVSLADQKKYEEALPYARRALEGYLKVQDKDHPDTKAAQEMVDELTKQEKKA